MPKPRILHVGPCPDGDQGPLVRGIAARGKLGAARACNIRVTNKPDVLTNDVAGLAAAMMLVRSGGMIGAQAWMRDGSWA